ncbi:putative tricarboxylic transport membrane protein [Halopolyspora algeriensis]|uniref:Putative tricarboxylic transport membrane protein n=1 Tax=Halopolyspora algeriensis TaxID=1500506 RepID=A0A368VHQ9_9ACTN|nr:tripartite tricarboxylate transporter TctB family protein [Halopolyspora algeriensis]RCW40928.1 putative tricarboxylic transport membrane protein [Halopolyspora algeriensis]TQM53986.1 putative tricarboxylic transport membrane protein [Halopolyspora algeriensis]
MNNEWLRGRAELGLAALVVLIGGLVLVNTATLETPATVNVVGPRVFPTVVGAVLLGIGVWLGIDVLRGGHGEPDAGEDVDLSRPSDWRAVASVGAAFFTHVALLRITGWLIAGAVLFWGVAVALGARRWLRAAGVAIVLSTVVYLVFSHLLGVSLPAGVFEGVL